MKLACCCISLFACFTFTVHANTEKAIFTAPRSDSVPYFVNELNLDLLSPREPSLRKALPVAFPTGPVGEKPQGEVSWYLLTALQPQQRHEVRVCWVAVQPTKFDIDIIEAGDVLKDHRLTQDITDFSERRSSAGQVVSQGSKASFLFLRITSTADFYTSNRTLMQSPPSVDVDIILDPFLANSFPRSLLPTAGYILILAIASWYISGVVWTFVVSAASGDNDKAHTD